jgi:ParB-like chromosome segregation protein Spo0J
MSQVMPNLTADEFERLRADIAERGVLDAVILDERGAVLDGHNRVAIADELGIDYPRQVLDLHGADDDARQSIAATLNINRRHLTRDQQRDLAIQFRLNGMKAKDTAALMGVPERTITSWSARAVGEKRQAKLDEAKVLVGDGLSENRAAQTVGIPRRTLSRHVGQNGKSADLAKPLRPAPPKRTGPPWQRHFTLWCRRVLPEDRSYLLAMSEELHRALDLLGETCKEETNGRAG